MAATPAGVTPGSRRVGRRGAGASVVVHRLQISPVGADPKEQSRGSDRGSNQVAIAHQPVTTPTPVSTRPRAPSRHPARRRTLDGDLPPRRLDRRPARRRWSWPPRSAWRSPTAVVAGYRAVRAPELRRLSSAAATPSAVAYRRRDDGDRRPWTARPPPRSSAAGRASPPTNDAELEQLVELGSRRARPCRLRSARWCTPRPAGRRPRAWRVAARRCRPERAPARGRARPGAARRRVGSASCSRSSPTTSRSWPKPPRSRSASIRARHRA